MSAFLYPSPELGLPETFFALNPHITKIGRHPNNDISLLLESVSRFHGQVEQVEGNFLIADLGSSNGTFVNGERLSGAQRLQDRDTITFGRADFVFSFLSPEELKRRGEKPSARSVSKTSTSSVKVVADEESGSTILSTRVSVESTPLPGSDLLEGKRDIGTLQRASQRLLTLYRLTEVIRSSTSQDEVLSRVMDLIFEVLPADRGVIMLLDEHSGQLDVQIVRYRKAIDSERELTISRTIIQKSLIERVAILSRDTKVDARFSASESIMAGDMRSAMCVPLVSKRATIGVMFLDMRESVRSFSDDDLAFASSLANDLAMSLDNMVLTSEKINNERLAAVGQTIAGLAHNIKNILQLAKGGIELMDNAIERQSLEDVTAFWPVVRRGIDRMQGLTQEMLDFSRQSRPELTEANVNEVIDDLVRTFQRDRVDSGVDIDLQLTPHIPIRKIDPDGLFKALMNLLSNAVDAFEGTGGHIVISTQFVRDTILVTVEDDGRGIPKGKLAKIFQPFFTTKGSKGTGLGLPMTKKYIEDMGGTIEVESEEGRGTAFTIKLPPLETRVTTDVESLAETSSRNTLRAPR